MRLLSIAEAMAVRVQCLDLLLPEAVNAYHSSGRKSDSTEQGREGAQRG